MGQIKSQQQTFPTIYWPYGSLINFSGTGKYISLLQMSIKTPFKPMIQENAKLPLPSEDVDHPKRQLNWSTQYALSHNYATKSPLITMGHHEFTPKIAHSLGRSPPIYIHSSTDPTHHPKRHSDPTSRFSTIHPLDRQTDSEETHRPTDGIGDKPVPTPACAPLIA